MSDLKWHRDDGLYTAKSLEYDNVHYTIFHDPEGWIPEAHVRLKARGGVNVESLTLSTIPCAKIADAKHLCDQHEKELP